MQSILQRNYATSRKRWQRETTRRQKLKRRHTDPRPGKNEKKKKKFCRKVKKKVLFLKSRTHLTHKHTDTTNTRTYTHTRTGTRKEAGECQTGERRNKNSSFRKKKSFFFFVRQVRRMADEVVDTTLLKTSRNTFFVFRFETLFKCWEVQADLCATFAGPTVNTRCLAS